jgi:hypothetical protein
MITQVLRVGFAGALVAVASVASAAAQMRPASDLPQTPHTASWYAANTAVRQEVLRVCRDDPGRAWSNPDCMNALYGQIDADIAAGTGTNGPSPWDTTPPTDPRFWEARPGMRRQKLKLCSVMKSAADRDAYHCAAVAGFTHS